MNEINWAPALIILGMGLAAGVACAWILRRRTPQDADNHADNRATDLVIADLEARRDDLYRRLREGEAEGITEAERQSLENAAARTLKTLDEARGAAPPAAGSAARAVTTSAPDRPVTAADRRPLLIGGVVLLGLSALIIGLLVYLAVGDAQPKPDQGGMSQAAPPSTGEDPHPATGGLPPELARQRAALEDAIAQNPDDLEARKQLAFLFLSANLHFDAFEASNEILSRDPNDIDGLYIQGVVRMTMGQPGLAVDLLDRVIAGDPAYFEAYAIKGIVSLRSGDRDGAMAAWQQGLDAAGGDHPGLGLLLERTRQGLTAEQILSPPDRAP